MSIAAGHDYVKTSKGQIYVRGSCFADWSHNAFSPADARRIATMLTDAADRLAPPKLPVRRGVTLTLDTSEAEALAAVLNRVGGDPDKSPRGKTQAVYGRLKDAGVKVPPHKFEVIAGGLWFKNLDGTGLDPITRQWADVLYAYMGADR